MRPFQLSGSFSSSHIFSKRLKRILSGCFQICFQHFCWYIVWAWCFLIFQILCSLPDLLSGGLFHVDWQRCFCRWYVWGIFRWWSVSQFRRLLCSSAELFLNCGQRSHLFVLDWLVCLLVSSSQLPCNVIQVFGVALCRSFFCLSCQVVNVASLICSYTCLHLSVSFTVLFLGGCLCCPGSAVIQGCLLVFSYPDLM